jgi:glycosyltransferase involved in cell wall biosynthesis
MRILVVHNHYQQLGGEDTIFATEADLLESYGHDVIRYTTHNDQVESMGPMSLTKATLWNSHSYKELRAIIQQKRPQVAHFHNTFPVISPAAYHAAKDEDVAVVQTLHNFRLLCPNGLFFREGKICEDCLGKPILYPGVINGCYRNSKTASAAVATMVKLHDVLKTWTKTIDIFIAYSDFALKKFIEGGLPADKFQFKTNFLHPAPDPGKGQGNYAVFVGRLSPEKGIRTLLDTWRKLDGKIPLKIVGDGPLAPLVKEATQENIGVDWLGRQPLDQVYKIIGEASCLIFPSEWYETFGRVAIEAFARGTPVVGSNIGAIAELITPFENGLLFTPGDSDDLLEKILWITSQPEKVSQMRHMARSGFEKKYTALENYQRLMEIYEIALSKVPAQKV